VLEGVWLVAERAEGVVGGVVLCMGVFVEVASMEVFVPDEADGASLFGEGEGGESCRLGGKAWGCGFPNGWAWDGGFSAVFVSVSQVLREEELVV